MNLRRGRIGSVLAAIVLAVFSLSGCHLLAGHAKTDATEDRREAAAKADAPGESQEAPILDPVVDGFGDSRIARAGDMAAEAVALTAVAGLVAGAVYLFRHRLAVLDFLTSILAMALAALAFIKAWA